MAKTEKPENADPQSETETSWPSLARIQRVELTIKSDPTLNAALSKDKVSIPKRGQEGGSVQVLLDAAKIAKALTDAGHEVFTAKKSDILVTAQSVLGVTSGEDGPTPTPVPIPKAKKEKVVKEAADAEETDEPAEKKVKIAAVGDNTNIVLYMIARGFLECARSMDHQPGSEKRIEMISALNDQYQKTAAVRVISNG